MRVWFACVLAALVAVPALAHGQERASVRDRVESSMVLTGTIDIAADGKVSGYAIDRAGEVPTGVLGLLARFVPGWRFEPVVVDGQPAAKRAYMSVRVVAKRQGEDSFAVSIRDASFRQQAPGERGRKGSMRPPKYPRAAIRAGVSGTVYAIVRIDRDGRVLDAFAEQVDLRVLASEHALVRWRKLMADAAIRKLAPESVREQVEVTMLLTGTIDIEPGGSVSSYALDDRAKVPDYVQSMVDREIPAWRFEPTLRDGLAVPVRSPMNLRVVARPVEGDSFQLSIAGVSFGKYSDDATDYVTRGRLRPPSYPVEAEMAGGKGTVYLVLRINREGRAEDMFVEQVNLTTLGTEAQMATVREVLSKAATDAAWKWTYHPPTTGEHVDDDYWAVRVPVEFRLYDDKPAAYGRWEAYLPGPRATAAWAQDGVSPDAIAGGGLHPVGSGPKLLTPLQEG